MNGIAGAFDLGATLECGQCFRWEALGEGEYRFGALDRWGTAGPRTLASLWDDPHWRNYFDLERDYDGIRRDLSALDPVLAQAAAFAPGIRILNQDPWEALCCFILSQNNNIPRIRTILHTLCRLYGQPLPLEGETLYAFPSAARIACLSLEDLAPLRAGYRAQYILSAAQAVAGGSLDLEALKAMDTESARQAIQSLRGVGRKVADCFLLFGLHKLDAFPVDTWMKKAQALYPPGFDQRAFGPLAGLAQQYIFYYARSTRLETRQSSD